jgi:hypothetical protein
MCDNSFDQRVIYGCCPPWMRLAGVGAGVAVGETSVILIVFRKKVLSRIILTKLPYRPDVPIAAMMLACLRHGHHVSIRRFLHPSVQQHDPPLVALRRAAE